jgi:hypothetical protein
MASERSEATTQNNNSPYGNAFMIERHDDINPWTEKLQDVKLPEVNDSWKALEAVLDRRMPAGRKKDRRRWLLLILLLLLLIGVCNGPGSGLLRRWKQSGRLPEPGKEWKDSAVDRDRTATANPHEMTTANPDEAPKVDPHEVTTSNPQGATPLNPQEVAKVNPDEITKADRKEDRPEVNHPNQGQVSETQPGGQGSERDQSIPPARSTRPAQPIKPGNSAQPTVPLDSVTSSNSTQPAPSPNPAASNSAQPAPPKPGNPGNAPKPSNTGTSPKPANPRNTGTPATPLKLPKPGTPVNPPKNANPANTKPAKPKDDKDDPERGWVIGVGLNQFFTVGGQENSDYNSGGTTGGLSDYIPVPMVRYNFSKRLFVQLEAQFNTPQYTSKNLLASQTPPDSVSAVQQEQSAVYIKKLFYFNLPLSVHFSPLPNTYIGAGLQYSRLSNGVGLFENKLISYGVPDSVEAAKIQSFKGDSVYREMKTHEFRFLVDGSYQYKDFILGVRYNRALSKFINVRISGSQITQARNSSLQLYIRYILWDQRKKRRSSSE